MNNNPTTNTSIDHSSHANHANNADTIHLPISQIREISYQALRKHGAIDWIAAAVADAVAVAEAKGNKICGLYYLESYCQQLQTGRVQGHLTPIVSQPKPSAVYVDAQFGFAQAAFAKGLPKAIETAQSQGICVLSVAHAHTCTSLGYFTEQIAHAGLIGIGMTNASAIVSPPNGNQPVIGTNPIAMSVPAQSGGIAFQFDQSTSAVALGKITMAKAAGTKIPLGWAIDAAGQPTDDPEKALGGSLCSAGGYKGWGFGLMAEIFAAGLTGSVNSSDVAALKAPEGKPHDLGQCYLLIDPQINQRESFWQRLSQLTEAVNAQDGARLPGSIDKSSNAVDVDRALWDKLSLLAKR